MGRRAEHVYTDHAQISHLEALVADLPANGHVILMMIDGSSYDGIVCERPNVQVFRDREENEGINAIVRLERPDAPDWNCYLWLDDIYRVKHLDSALGGEH